MSAYDILIMNNQSDKMKGIHMKKTKEQHNERKKEIMEKCFECYAENGLTGTVKADAPANVAFFRKSLRSNVFILV